MRVRFVVVLSGICLYTLLRVSVLCFLIWNMLISCIERAFGVI